MYYCSMQVLCIALIIAILAVYSVCIPNMICLLNSVHMGQKNSRGEELKFRHSAIIV